MLADYANIAEILGTIAVVISILFLASEVRQNTKQIKADSVRTGLDFVRALYALVQTHESAELVLKGLNNFDDLTAIEKPIFDAKLVNMTLEFEITREVFANGSLREDHFLAYEELMTGLIISPGGTTWLKRTEHTFPPQILENYQRMKIKYPDAEPINEYFKYKKRTKQDE